VLALALGTVVAGPAAARTTAWHFTAVGPGAQAVWENEDGVSTNLLVFNQLNAPGTRGFFEEVLIVLDGWNDDGTIAWEAVYDSWDAPQQPAISIQQPLASASVAGMIPFAGCFVGTCPNLPIAVDVSEAWTGVGKIDRIVGAPGWFDNDPGALLFLSHMAHFDRNAVLADDDPFDGALGDLGWLLSARLFDVHVTQVSVCHPGAVCP
jgi:hypothetical protein